MGNLKDCDQIIVFAATLGCGADHLIQKYSRLQMSRAVWSCRPRQRP